MKEEIELRESESGLEWPYYKGQKALSASTLTQIFREIDEEWKKIPEYIILKAAKNGNLFHSAIQEFLLAPNKAPKLPSPISLNTQKKIQGAIDFFQRNDISVNFRHFLGSEKLHYFFYQGELLATYVDLEFTNYIIELKSNSSKMRGNNLNYLKFQIQLLIQHLCTKKRIYLLWSDEKETTFRKFQPTKELLKILDTLIGFAKNKEEYPLLTKKNIIEKLLENYSPTNKV